MLARTNRLSPAMFTRTRTVTGRTRCEAMSRIALTGALPNASQYWGVLNGGQLRGDTIPWAGSQCRLTAKMKMNISPSQNVGRLKKTYDSNVTVWSNSE